MWLPVNTHLFVGLPINAHPGAFGAVRKYDRHTGIDLYGHPGQLAMAMEPGEVVAVGAFTGPKAGTRWWLDTDYVLVRNNAGGFWLYGELLPAVRVGDLVLRGSKVGELTPVLPVEKHRPDIPGHSVTMLYLERYNDLYTPDQPVADWIKSRPNFLEDPTPYLIHILHKIRHPFKFLTY